MPTFAATQDKILRCATEAIPDDITSLIFTFKLADQATLFDVDHVHFSFGDVDNNCPAITARCNAGNLG